MSPSHSPSRKIRTAVVAALAGGALLVPGALALDASAAHRDTPAASAATAPLAARPVTREALRADGPFSVDQQTLRGSQLPEGLGEVDFYTPVNAPAGRGPAVVAMPGHSGANATVAWMAKRLASHGYVVMLTRPTMLIGFTPARVDAYRKALAYLPTASPVAGRVDPARMGIWGFSMSGGAAIEVASTMPQLKAVVGAFPWHPQKSFPGVTSPTLVITGEKDGTAVPSVHGGPLYDGLTGTSERALAELAGAGHLLMQQPDARSSEMTLAWFGRFLAGDTRYSQFLCPGPAGTSGYSKYTASCPM